MTEAGEQAVGLQGEKIKAYVCRATASYCGV